nr:MAG TPA: protein of unknown function (DUF777) [Caudoviricetes sp.]
MNTKIVCIIVCNYKHYFYICSVIIKTLKL